MPNSAYSFKKIVKSDTLDFATTYRKGDYVILRDLDFSDREWVCRSLTLLSTVVYAISTTSLLMGTISLPY